MWKRAALAALLLATSLAYWPAVDGAFLLDDHAMLKSPLVLDPLGQGLGAWLASPRPLVSLTFALDRAAFGFDTRGWHLTNLAVHLLATLLALRLARRTLARAGLPRPDGPALAAAGLFALHPLQSEAVAYVTQRAEALASALAVAALLCLLARDEATGRRRAALLAAAAALQALGLLAKPVAAVVPAYWLLHAALIPAPGEAGDPAAPLAGALARVRRRLPAALPLLALSGLAAWRDLTATAASGHAGFAIPDLPPTAYWATQLRVVPTYLRLLLAPYGQVGDWWFPASRGFLEPAVLAGGLLLGALAGGALWLGLRALRREGAAEAAGRAAAFGALFFLLALLPSSLVPLRDLVAEHRPYLAALGLFLAAAAGGALLLRRMAGGRAAVAGAVLTALLLAGLAGLTARRAAVWTSALAFWQDAAEKAPRKARVHQNLGDALHSAGRPAEAVASFQRALERMDDHTIDPERLVSNLVNALLAMGHVEQARAVVQAALATRTGDPPTLALLAMVELVGQRDAAAEAAARRALAADPAQELALKVLGLVAERRGDAAAAREAFRAAADLHTLDPLIWERLGAADAARGDAAAACLAFGRAASLTGNGEASARAVEARARLGCR